jgi:D-3-phosphoglycerate dehydrogenase
MKYKVVIADDRYYPDYEAEKKVLEPAGAEVLSVRSNLESEIINAVADADGLIANLPPVTAEVINRMEKCRVISRYGVGYDNVDVEAATARGIWVANVPDYCGEDVSDQAMGLFLSCVRKVAQRDRQVRSGVWDIKATSPQYRIKGKTFVFFGYGMIARAVHRKLAGFEPGKVLVYDPYIDASAISSNGGQKVDMETALRDGDYFSVHMPVTDKTRKMFNEVLFSKMKPTAIFINTSRGAIVDEKALYRALKEGWIDSAGLDVFEKEPIEKDNPLLTLENITLSGHVGFYTEESILELKTKAACNVREVLLGGKPLYPVNKV